MQPPTTRQTIRSRLKDCPLTGDILTIFLFHFLSLLSGMVGSIVVARALGPTQKGLLNLFSLLTTLLTEFGLFGLNSGLLYYLANRKTPLARVHAAALWGSLALGGACFVAVVAFFRPLLTAFQGLPPYFVLTAGILGPFLLYRMLWSNLMTGINRAPHVYRVSFVISLLSLLGILALWRLAELSATSLIWLNIVLLTANSVYGFLYLSRAHQRRFIWDRPCLTGALRYGGVVYFGVVFNFLHFRVDQLLINYFQGPRGVGIYTVSVSWVELLWLIDYAVINAALYDISSLEPRESWDLTWRLCKWTSAMLALAAVVLMSAAGPLIRGIYGREFLGAVRPLMLLVPGVVAWSAGRILAQFISYNAGRPHLCTGAALVGTVLNIAGNLYSISRWGLSGAAVTSSVSYLVTCGLVALAFASLRRQPTIPDAAHVSSV